MSDHSDTLVGEYREPRFDAYTGQPLVPFASIDPETGREFRAARTAFFPPKPGWGFKIAVGGWLALGTWIAWWGRFDSYPHPRISTPQAIATAWFVFSTGVWSAILWSFLSRKARGRP